MSVDTKAHADLTVLDGVHGPATWSCADAAEVVALDVGDEDVGKFARAEDSGTLYLLVSQSGGVGTWYPVGVLTGAAPSSVGTADSAGVLLAAARLDHVHAHGNQTSATLHALATTGAHGFMSSTDKSKLDNLLGATAPSSVGTANSAGSSTSAARIDHVHAHGNQTSATLHAAATTSANGFMSSADKTAVDNMQLSVEVSASTYTLTSADLGKTLWFTNAAGCTVTVGTGIFAASGGKEVYFVQEAAVQVTLTFVGVTVVDSTPAATIKSEKQGAIFGLKGSYAANKVLVMGQVSPT